MSKNKNRIKDYLIARQFRAARHEAFERAAEAGILERDYIGENERSGLKWRLADDCAVSLTGDEDHDFELIAKFMKRSGMQLLSSDIDSEPDSVSVCDDNNSLDKTDHANIGDFGPAEKVDQDSVTVSSRNSNAAIQKGYVLFLVRKFAPPLKPDEVTTALLLAKTLDLEADVSGQLMLAMKKQNPIIGIQAPVYGFVRQLGLMLEDGLILPFYISLSAIEPEPALSGRYNDLMDSRRRKSIACMSGKFARQSEVGDDLRRSISKHILTQIKPVIIADEDKTPLPVRIEAVADFSITGEGIDAELIAEVLSICCNIPKAKSMSLMAEKQFNPVYLGIDDIAAAIRPGRSLARIVDTLMTLEADNASKLEDANDGTERFNGSGHLSGLVNSTKSSRPNKYVGFYDIIEPCNFVSEEAGSSSGKNHLFVETLSGYRDAQQWALDLKQDLSAWQNDEVDWSELSTRLLLSGPPGTGKTTYAKALCNTLQIPLISTSVARWLEASNLGDVLTAISATFRYARQHSPCILFIDEIDNIGSRNGGGTNESASHKNDDYWASLINRLLELLDGVAKTDGVIILGATNRPNRIDPALLRSGRLEKHIIIPPPDAEALVGIIAHHLGQDLDAIVEQGLEASKGLIVSSMNDVPDAAPNSSAKNVAASNVDKNSTCDREIVHKGVTNDQT